MSLMQQYKSIKDRHRDAVLLYRLGDFYEMFHEDAETASRVLGITLTARSKDGGKIPMAGFPYHAAAGYIERLLKAGHKVAICEQIEDAAEAKGIVERDVVRIITPGTLLDEGILEAKRPNHLAAVFPNADRMGLAWVDLSTGRFEVEEVPPEGLEDALGRIDPAECLLPGTDGEESDTLPFRTRVGRLVGTVTTQPEWTFDRETAEKLLLEHFRTATLDGFGCGKLGLAVASAGAILRYLKETHKAGLDHIRSIRPFDADRSLVLDRNTLRSLEVLATSRDRGEEGSLLGTIDRTRTAMGGRLLRAWLAAPLRDPAGIRARHDAVETFLGDATARKRARDALREMYDLERLSSRIASRRANGRDLVSLAQTLERLPDLAGSLAALGEPLAPLVGRIPDAKDLVERIHGTLIDEPPVPIREGGLIRIGVDADLDRLREIQRAGKGWLARFQADEAVRTGIPSLKVGYNKVFGYYIEITNVHRDKAPPEYARKQTLKNAERYITPALKERETEVLEAKERGNRLEQGMFEALRDDVAGSLDRILAAADAIAEADVLAALAQVAAEHDYVRPEMTEDPVFDVRAARHPVLERTLKDETFVPNDLVMDPETRLILLTGPNMAGKSTYIRQTALLVLLAQAGSFVPADRARIGIADRIFTRIGAEDEIHAGRSTFMVEMTETAAILHRATEKSLVILDEVGRGTSTYDGLSLAWAIAEDLARRVRGRTLFATHYHEMAALAEEIPTVRNFNVAVREWEGEVVFLHEIVPGPADRSYGIHVARLAGVPKEVLARARTLLGEFERRSAELPEPPAPKGKADRIARAVEPDLFAPPEDGYAKRIRGLDLDGMTPLDALNLLSKWKKEAKKE